jgi:hypothetical protein
MLLEDEHVRDSRERGAVGDDAREPGPAPIRR